MLISAPTQPTPFGKINERQVLRAIQARGPLSRAEVARLSGISAPTASRAVEALLHAGLLEEGEVTELGRGRPARKLRLAGTTVQVLGLVLNAGHCELAAAGLDGRLHAERTVRFETPGNYEALIDTAVANIEPLLARPGVTTLGLAISMPGLIDYRLNRGILSPNLPITDQRSPGRDLSDRLGIDCVMVQESHALCLAERSCGDARGLEDFAMMDVATGVGLGVMSGGRLLTGHSGLAGEIGHVTVEARGRLCGCGNRGCLETLACDSALARMVSEGLGRKVTIEEMIALAGEERAILTGALETVRLYLAVGMAMVINLFNPSTLFVHGRFFAIDAELFPALIEETRRRALGPSFNECRIVQARSSKSTGAIAAIIEHLTHEALPTLEAAHPFKPRRLKT